MSEDRKLHGRLFWGLGNEFQREKGNKEKKRKNCYMICTCQLGSVCIELSPLSFVQTYHKYDALYYFRTNFRKKSPNKYVNDGLLHRSILSNINWTVTHELVKARSKRKE